MLAFESDFILLLQTHHRSRISYLMFSTQKTIHRRPTDRQNAIRRVALHNAPRRAATWGGWQIVSIFVGYIVFSIFKDFVLIYCCVAEKYWKNAEVRVDKNECTTKKIPWYNNIHNPLCTVIAFFSSLNLNHTRNDFFKLRLQKVKLLF